MATLNVSDRTVEGKHSRKRIQNIDLKSNVAVFKSKISPDIKKKENEFDLVYCGQFLKDESSLESYGLHSGSTVHALIRQTYTSQTSDEKAQLSPSEVKQIQQVLQSAIKNPAYRSTVENIISTPDTLHDIVNAVPGLNNDPAVLTLFQDHELLSVLAHPGNIRRTIAAHPCFPQLARMLAAAVREAETKGEYVRSSTGVYSLDQMSDDEDSPGPSGQPITANQLAAALAAATGATAPVQSTGSPANNPMITTDFFQQAILQAQSAALTGQIQQMREMGITDENVARQALQATNGDLQAALDLIFGGGL